MIKGSGGLLSIMKLLRERFPCDTSDRRGRQDRGEEGSVGKKAGGQDQMRRKRKVQLAIKRHVRCGRSSSDKFFGPSPVVTRVDKYYRRLNYVITPSPRSCTLLTAIWNLRARHILQARTLRDAKCNARSYRSFVFGNAYRVDLFFRRGKKGERLLRSPARYEMYSSPSPRVLPNRNPFLWAILFPAT